MTREERLKFCSLCKNRKEDFKRGLLCSLTNEKATFEGECKDYVLDESEEAKQKRQKEELQKEVKKQDWYNDLAFCAIFSYSFAKGFGHNFFIAFLSALAAMALIFVISNSVLIHLERKRGKRFNDGLRILIKDVFAVLVFMLATFLLF